MVFLGAMAVYTGIRSSTCTDSFPVSRSSREITSYLTQWTNERLRGCQSLGTVLKPHSPRSHCFLIDKSMHLYLIPILLGLFVRINALHYPVAGDVSCSFCVTSLSGSFSIDGFSFQAAVSSWCVWLRFQASIPLSSIPCCFHWRQHLQ